MSEQRLFAGFWRDGAVVVPSDEHCDHYGFLIVKHKASREHNGMSIWQRGGGNFANVYWLDTTTPKELTPEEAFELCKVLFPKVKRIARDSAFAITFDCDGETSIVWGETTEYPPKQRWRVPTDADKGRKCRWWYEADRKWNKAEFITTFDGGFVVKGGYYPFPIQVSKCEVLE